MPYMTVPQKQMKPKMAEKMNELEAQGWRLVAIRQGHLRLWLGYEPPWFIFHRE